MSLMSLRGVDQPDSTQAVKTTGREGYSIVIVCVPSNRNKMF